MLVRARVELESLLARKRAGADAGVRELVPEIPLPAFPAVRREEASDDGDVEVEPLDGPVSLAEIEVAHHDDRGLVDLGEVERFRGEAEALVRVAGREDRAGPVPLPRTEREVQVPLLRLRRKPRGRAGSLAQDCDDGRLDHPSLAQALDHQREASARRRRHRPHASKTRANRHVDRCEFVLHLLHDDAVGRGVVRHPVHDRRGGRHRVLREELAPRGEGTQRDRLVACDQ